MIKPGILAILRTTEEPVAVIRIAEISPNMDSTWDKWEVRRPVNTKENGVIHIADTFYAWELESREEDEFRAKVTAVVKGKSSDLPELSN